MDCESLILVVSDLHLSKGVRLADGSVNLFEDFREDDRFVSFLEYYQGRYPKTPIELVVNGDFFDFLRMEKHGRYPDVMYESLAIQQFKAFLDGHRPIVQALQQFLQLDKNSVVVVVGESDCGLLWPGVQRVLQKRVSTRLKVIDGAYTSQGLYFEHGNQYDEISRLPKNRFGREGNSSVSILNLPWAAFFIADYILPVRQMRPQFSKVRPVYAYFIWMLVFDIGFAIKMVFRFVSIFLNKRLVRHAVGYGMIRTFQILKRAAFGKSLNYYAREILRSRYDIHTVFFGHSHAPVYQRMKDGKEYLNTGTWTNTVSLDIKNLGGRTMLTYATVEQMADGRSIARLLRWQGAHKPVRDFV